ncbi:ELMO domain-containing protein [Aphelenchoides fujianensis]|nr:ELMO domain-containing protein [Aphelenchoides fujianensis]
MNLEFEEHEKGKRYLCIPKRNPFNYANTDDKTLIVALSRTPYNESVPLHWKMLGSIYVHLLPDSPPPDRFGDHWETVGFQGSDPATDLRGAGIFGLCQLLYAVSGGLDREFLDRAMELANRGENGFPLAVVGLNFTHLLLKRVKKGKMDKYARKKSSFVDFLNRVYARCFHEMLEIWTSEKCTLHDFGKILAVVGKKIKKPKRFLRSSANLPSTQQTTGL